MNRLFFRIWIANWLVFVVVVFSSVFVFDKLRERDLNKQINNPPPRTQDLLKDCREAVRSGETAEAWVKRISKEIQPVFLLDPQGNDIAGRRVPKQLRAHLDRSSNRDARSGKTRNNTLILEGYPALKLVTMRRQPKGPLRLFSSFILIGMGFLASGLAALVLARYISFPIKQLYLASESVASGDFKTNVAAAVGQRKDEIADLARHFDLMAAALDNSNKTQQDLLRDVSHELRSPLTRLLLLADLLESTEGDERKELQQRLKKDLGELDTLIDEVMALTRFGNETSEMKFVKSDLITTLNSLFDDARFEANALNKVVNFKHEEGSYFVSLSPVHFASAVENIVRNAIRHTKENTEVLAELSRENDKVVLSVFDEGEGLEEVELTKIFSPFYRSASARARYKGAGIGLALADRIIKAHGGEVSARNRPNGGLLVRIVLPAV